MGHEDAVYLAKLAEQAERYEGMLCVPTQKPMEGALTEPVSRDGRQHEDRRLGGPRPHG